MAKVDLANKEAIVNIAQGCDEIFHVAAKAGVWGSYDSYYQTNVVGTQNILAACKTHSIPKLIYTSTPSVVFSGKDEDGINESIPYAKKHLCHYTQTKAQAEQLVLNANSQLLSTVALRPHLIWGPKDNHLVPRIIARGKAGKIKLVGNQDKLVDSVYIDNAANAHIAASNALNPQATCCGKPYFISNGEPLLMKDLINKILACGNVAPVTKRVNAKVAYGAGAILETIYTVLGKKEEPIMTRFVAKQLACSHWFDINNAKTDLGYAPKVKIDDGMKNLKAWLTQA